VKNLLPNHTLFLIVTQSVLFGALSGVSVDPHAGALDSDEGRGSSIIYYMFASQLTLPSGKQLVCLALRPYHLLQ